MISASENKKLIVDNKEEWKKRLERGKQKLKLIQKCDKGGMPYNLQNNYDF